MKSIELFSGAGGLAMGLSFSGFKHEAVVEWDHDACETVRANQALGIEPMREWPLVEGDVSRFDYRPYTGRIDVLAGGPPCQPFSLGGKHRGHLDERNMFPEVVRAVRELRPRAIIIENVKGLLRKSFSHYVEYIRLQLSHPDIVRKKDEDWQDHLGRLEREETSGSRSGLNYNIVFRLLNAANYGVPQKRERVFWVGFRSDLNVRWSFPDATHSQDALLRDKWVTGEYWERHQVTKKKRPLAPTGIINRLLALRQKEDETKPWKTIRDTIADLPDPSNPNTVNGHRLVPGARAYQGHTGSAFDEPSKTLKAGDHGVPGGENMIAFPNGSVRYLTLREAARIQTFPDSFHFKTSWTESMRQLGNAVPVQLAATVARSVHSCLEQV